MNSNNQISDIYHKIDTAIRFLIDNETNNHIVIDLQKYGMECIYCLDIDEFEEIQMNIRSDKYPNNIYITFKQIKQDEFCAKCGDNNYLCQLHIIKLDYDDAIVII